MTKKHLLFFPLLLCLFPLIGFGEELNPVITDVYRLEFADEDPPNNSAVGRISLRHPSNTDFDKVHDALLMHPTH